MFLYYPFSGSFKGAPKSLGGGELRGGKRGSDKGVLSSAAGGLGGLRREL